ncbi:MAG: aldo/keto reductase, partial [Bacillus sp. (in: firmicutes)]
KGYQEYSFKELNEVLPLLKEKVAGFRSFTEIALQYNLANPAVASVVTGASSPEQIRSNAKAVRSQPLSAEEVLIIKELTKANTYQEHR